MVAFKIRHLQFNLPALRVASLELHAWNYIGISYDYDSGMARMWHDGNEVERVDMGVQMELATQFPIRIGALDGNDYNGLYYSGRIASLRIYRQALSGQQIRQIGGLQEARKTKPRLLSSW